MARKPAKTGEVSIEYGSDNVFADLGYPDPEDAALRASLAMCIREVVERRRLSQTAAAEIMGIDQPKVSAILRGYLSKFSSERLMRLLRRLGQDIAIVVTDAPRGRTGGRIRVGGQVAREAKRTVRRAATRG